jgi:hypothetical protein
MHQETEKPDDLERLRTPAGVDARLQESPDCQESGPPLTDPERRESEPGNRSEASTRQFVPRKVGIRIRSPGHFPYGFFPASITSKSPVPKFTPHNWGLPHHLGQLDEAAFFLQ